MTSVSTEQYEAPAILGTYYTAELISDAVDCFVYPSDAALKDDIRPVDQPLAKLEQISTRP